MEKASNKETRWENMYKKEIDDLIKQNATAQERFLGKGNAHYTESVITITDEIRSVLIVHDGQFSEYLENFLYLKNFLELIGIIVYDCFKSVFENDKIKVTKKGKIKTTKIGYFFDCKKIVWYTTSL